MKRLISLLLKTLDGFRPFGCRPANNSTPSTGRNVCCGKVILMLHATPFSPEKAYINSTEMSMLLDISPSSVRDHASGRRGPQLPSLKWNGQWYFTERDVRVWIAYFQTGNMVIAA